MRIGVIALDEIEPFLKCLDGGGRSFGLGRDDGIVGMLTKRLVGPIAARNADDRNLELSTVF